MDVSIIIVNYNTYELTCRCIESVFKESKGFNFEVILVDNASAECKPSSFKKKFPEISLLISKENLGFSGGCNLGLKHASGEYVLLLNSDAELVENSIFKCLQYIKRLDNFGALSPRLVFPDLTNQSVAQRFPSVKLRLFELFRLQKFLSSKKAGRLLLGSYFNQDENLKVDWVWGAFFLFPKKLIDYLPGSKLNEDYFMYFEDVQWCWDFRKLGFDIYFFADTTVIHKMGGSNAQKDTLMKQNEKKFIVKNFEPFQRWVLGIL